MLKFDTLMFFEIGFWDVFDGTRILEFLLKVLPHAEKIYYFYVFGRFVVIKIYKKGIREVG